MLLKLRGTGDTISDNNCCGYNLTLHSPVGMRAMKKNDIIKAFADYVSPGKADIYTKYDMVIVPGRRRGR